LVVAVLVAAGFGGFAEAGAFAPGEVMAFDEFFEVVVMRADGAVEVFFADAGGEMQNDLVPVDIGVFFQQFAEVAEFAEGGPAATAAASEVDITNVSIRRIIAKAAIPLAERLFAEKAAAAFFDDVALQYDYVFDLRHFLSF